jgi:hypothetical protein
MAKQTKITIETDSLLILRGRTPLWGWCQWCNAETEMIPVDGVGVISNLAAPEVQAWMKSEDLHRSQAPDGETLICLNSLLKRVQKFKNRLMRSAIENAKGGL